jgi:hypothetical protein
MATATFAGALALPMAMPADAAPVITGGLVNVTVVDVLSGNQVTAQVPVSVAANVCGVPVSVLAQDLRNGPVDCSNDHHRLPASGGNGWRRGRSGSPALLRPPSHASTGTRWTLVGGRLIRTDVSSHLIGLTEDRCP